MDSFRRLIFFSVGVLISAFVLLPFAKAETQPATDESYSATLVPGESNLKYWPTVLPNSFEDSGAAVCARADVQQYVQNSQISGCTTSNFAYSSSPSRCTWNYSGTCGSGSFYGPNVTSGQRCSDGSYPSPSCPSYYTCPNGGSLSGTTCVKYTCPATGNWTLNGQTCERPDVCPDAGTPVAGNVYGQPGKYSTSTFCVAGCEVAAGGGRSAGQSPDGMWFTEWYGPFEATGNGNCTQNPDQTTQDAPRCPVDQCMGQVNGVNTCVACSARDSDYPPRDRQTTEDNPGQPTTETTETTETHTECNHLGCTTTTTTTTTEQDFDANGDPSGPPRTTVTTETEEGDGTELGEFCEKNPSSPLCLKGSFGGACGSFSCEGDAIQCAIATEQHNRNCELLTDTGSLTRSGAAAAFDSGIATFDDDQLTDSSALDNISGQSLFVGGLSDQSFSVAGTTITIPFSSLVPYLQYAGAAFLIVCGLISIRIFSTVVN